jgi:hypothetical protein
MRAIRVPHCFRIKISNPSRRTEKTGDCFFALCYLLLNPPRLLFGQRLEWNAEPLGRGGAVREQGDVER